MWSCDLLYGIGFEAPRSIPYRYDSYKYLKLEESCLTSQSLLQVAQVCCAYCASLRRGLIETASLNLLLSATIHALPPLTIKRNLRLWAAVYAIT